MKLSFLPAAREELEAAALYLDERTPGLGADLVGDVERIGELACEFPQIGRSLDSIHRSIPLQRFSIGIKQFRLGSAQSRVAHPYR